LPHYRIQVTRWGSADELRAARERMGNQETKRQERMAPHVESAGTDGFYEVVEVVKPSVAARH